MNLHGIVSGAISAILPQTTLSIQVSTGYMTNPDGSRTPSYAPVQVVQGDMQALYEYSDLIQLESLNIQGVRHKIYINGEIDGLVRADKKGGDLITTPDGKVWKVVMILELWPDWCCAAVTLQDDAP